VKTRRGPTLKRTIASVLLAYNSFGAFCLLVLGLLLFPFQDASTRGTGWYWVSLGLALAGLVLVCLSPVRIRHGELRHGLWPFRRRDSLCDVERFEVVADPSPFVGPGTTWIGFTLRSDPRKHRVEGSAHLRETVRHEWLSILEEARRRCLSQQRADGM
jgi:hypothetical protein